MVLLTLLSFLTIPSPANIIDGYTDRLSAYPGDTVALYLNALSESENAAVGLYDLNGKKVYSFETSVFPQEVRRGKPYQNGFGYRPTARIATPQLPSGVYLWEKTIPFIVKSRNPRILVLYPSNTEAAYSPAGGRSFYNYNSDQNEKAEQVSFLRPVIFTRYAGAFLRWMNDANFRDVGYITDADMDNYDEVKRASLLIVAGHSEYWTLQARRNFDRFVDSGKDALILSGNTMWWQVRYNDEGDQLICYKSADEDKIKSSSLKTTRWNDPTLGYPIVASIGVDFAMAGYGRKVDKGWDGYKIVSNSPLLANTGLKPGDIVSCPSDEYDGAPLLGFSDQGIPVLNRQALGFSKIELVGFDHSTWNGTPGVATWIVFRKAKKSGIIINTASTDWCSERGIGASALIRKITSNMITMLLNHDSVFAPDFVKPIVPQIAH